MSFVIPFWSAEIEWKVQSTRSNTCDLKWYNTKTRTSFVGIDLIWTLTEVVHHIAHLKASKLADHYANPTCYWGGEASSWHFSWSAVIDRVISQFDRGPLLSRWMDGLCVCVLMNLAHSNRIWQLSNSSLSHSSSSIVSNSSGDKILHCW